MDGTTFYYVGGALVLAALGISAVGIRGKASFPPSRAVLAGGSILFFAVVACTAALAVVNAEEEQEHRDKELAEEEAAAEEEVGPPPDNPGGQPQAAAGGNQQPPAPPPGGKANLDVTSPDDGSLVFEPDGLAAQPGTLTIAYANPSPVPHSLAIETADGNVLGETDVFAAGEDEFTVDGLAPGEYVFFCTVPGHREGGMEGDLTVE